MHSIIRFRELNGLLNCVALTVPTIGVSGVRRVCHRCWMPHPKQPKVEIKRTKTSLGWAYRIYVDGAYVGTGLTQASARDGAKRVLVNCGSVSV